MAGVGPPVPLVVLARLRVRPCALGLAPVRPLVALPLRALAPAAHNACPRLLSPLAAAHCCGCSVLKPPIAIAAALCYHLMLICSCFLLLVYLC